MAKGSRWFVAAVAAAATLTVGAGGTAQAQTSGGAPRFHPLGTLGAPMTAAERLSAMRARDGAADGGGLPSVAELVTNPIWVTIDGVSYQMQMFAIHFFGAGAPPGDVEMQLARHDGVAGQWHLYDFSKDGVQDFTSPKGSVSTAKLSCGTNFGSSRLEAAFTKDAPVTSTSCTTFDGSKGTLLRADGTISSSAFKVATGTSPFFGDITTPPLTGTMYLDPGCVGKRIPQGCPADGLTELQVGRRQTQWGFASDGTRVEEFTATGTRRTLHEIDSFPLPASDFSADLSPSAAVARVRSGGNPFMEGTAVFHSTSAAQTFGPIGCRQDGVRHHFNVTQYLGTASQGPKPFLALFDTGLLALTSQQAALVRFSLID